MVLKDPKMAKKGIRKVQKYHETAKIGPNFALRSRRKMAKNDRNFCKRTHRASFKYFDANKSALHNFTH